MSCVTVLVAVYNAERYLRQCISSLLEQTYSCLQIICIDDASTDGSLELLHDYAKKDSRIVVIEQQQNRGQAHARNVGLRQAVGDYVCFVDSDDWLAPDAIEKTVAVFEQNPLADCVLFTLVKTDENGINPQPYRMKEFESLSGSAAFEASLNWSIHGVYMVRKKLHQAFPYDESQRAYSDDNTTRIHYYNSREVRLSKGIYFYRQHSASTSHQVSVRRFDYILANRSMKHMLEELHANNSIISVYEQQRWLNLIDTYMFYFQYRQQLSFNDRQLALQIMKSVWKGIEVNRLKLRSKMKFGYFPFRLTVFQSQLALSMGWLFFRIQEEIYFTLRKYLLHR